MQNHADFSRTARQNHFADRLRAYRKRKRWTQTQLAAELGIGAKYLGMLETGAKKIRPVSSLAKLFTIIESVETMTSFD